MVRPLIEFPGKRGYEERMKSTVAAIDFGTSKIVTLIAESSGNQRCDIVGAGVSYFDGYAEDGWHNPDQLNIAIEKSITEAREQARRPITEINVGVPGALSRVYAVEARVELKGTDPRVTLQDIKQLFKKAVEQLGVFTGVVVHRSPAWFCVDDGKPTLEPIGMKGTELKALVSFVVASKFFLDSVDEQLRAMGIAVSGFFSTATGEALLFLPEAERDHTSVLIDVGYTSTDVMMAQGDAVTYLKTIPIGSGHIACDLADGLKIQLPAAEQVKRAFIYGSSAPVGQVYNVSTSDNGVAEEFTQEQVSEILEPRVEELAEAVDECIKHSGITLGQWSTIYLTGGGISMNRGGREFLAGKLERPVREIPKRTMKLNSPIYSSSLGLMDLIIDTIEQQHAPTPGILGAVKDFFRSLLGG